jgi:hypothetical protein
MKWKEALFAGLAFLITAAAGAQLFFFEREVLLREGAKILREGSTEN